MRGTRSIESKRCFSSKRESYDTDTDVRDRLEFTEIEARSSRNFCL